MKKLLSLATLTLLVAACATTGTPSRSVDQRRDPVDGLINRYQTQLARGDGTAVVTLNGYFEMVRTSCALSEEACVQTCNRRADIRNLMNGWNRVHSRSFTRNGLRIDMTWDEDIDPTCDSR